MRKINRQKLRDKKTYLAIFLSKNHHMDDFVHAVIVVKPESEDKWTLRFSFCVFCIACLLENYSVLSFCLQTVRMLQTCCVHRLFKLANAEHAAHKDIEAVRHPKSYVLVKEVTKEVRLNG